MFSAMYNRRWFSSYIKWKKTTRSSQNTSGRNLGVEKVIIHTRKRASRA